MTESFIFISEESTQTFEDYCGLKDTYNNCIRQMSLLRKFHLNVATRYLSVTKLGTGTSTFRILLKECIDDTEKCTIKNSNA